MAATYPVASAAPSATSALIQAAGTIRKDTQAVRADADGDYSELLSNELGALYVTGQGNLPTYSAAFSGVTSASSATDIAVIVGSATKTVWVQEVRLSCSATAAKTLAVILLKRTADNTAGTSAATGICKHNVDNATATAVVRTYTANPSAVGATANNVRAATYTISALDAVGGTELVWDLRGYNSHQGFRLDGATELLCVNLGGVTAGSGNIWAGSFTWTEQATTS